MAGVKDSVGSGIQQEPSIVLKIINLSFSDNDINWNINVMTMELFEPTI